MKHKNKNYVDSPSQVKIDSKPPLTDQIKKDALDEIIERESPKLKPLEKKTSLLPKGWQGSFFPYCILVIIFAVVLFLLLR